MNRRTKLRSVLVAGVLIAAAMPATFARGTNQSRYKDEGRSSAEEIYVARTTRTQHKSGATPACAAAPFPSANEDYYELWSIGVRASDARVTETRQSAQSAPK